MLAAAAGVASAVIPDLWLRAAVIIGPTTLLSAVSASGSLALARRAEEREVLDASADVVGSLQGSEFTGAARDA